MFNKHVHGLFLDILILMKFLKKKILMNKIDLEVLHTIKKNYDS